MLELHNFEIALCMISRSPFNPSATRHETAGSGPITEEDKFWMSACSWKYRTFVRKQDVEMLLELEAQPSCPSDAGAGVENYAMQPPSLKLIRWVHARCAERLGQAGIAET